MPKKQGYQYIMARIRLFVFRKRLEEVCHDRVQLKTIIVLRLVAPCEQSRGLLQQIIVTRECCQILLYILDSRLHILA
jgi:hypothetical protein